MRRRNWRVVSGGVFLIILASVFYFVMMANVDRSTDPIEMMQLSGTITGSLIGLSVAMIIIGVIGKKT